MAKSRQRSMAEVLAIWADKKHQSLALALAYFIIGLKTLSGRVAECAPQMMRIGVLGENPDQIEFRTFFYGACKARLCPICATLRGRRVFARLAPLFEQVLAEHRGARALFVTLTVPSMPLDQLRSAGSEIIVAFRRLTQRKAFKKAVLGWMRALEVTINADTGMAHPHLHVVLLVHRGYFSKKEDLYLSQAEWLVLWRDVMRNQAIGIVDVRVLKPRDPSLSLASALAEVTKYPMKPIDVFRRSGDGYVADPEVIKALHFGLKGRRLLGFGGVLRGMAKAVDEYDLCGDRDWAVSEDAFEAFRDDPPEDEMVFQEEYTWNGDTYGGGSHAG